MLISIDEKTVYIRLLEKYQAAWKECIKKQISAIGTSEFQKYISEGEAYKKKCDELLIKIIWTEGA